MAAQSATSNWAQVARDAGARVEAVEGFTQAITLLNQGRVVEYGTADDVILNPQNPYTRELRAASPDPEKHFASASASASSNGGDL